jgi:hypothetical protein
VLFDLAGLLFTIVAVYLTATAIFYLRRAKWYEHAAQRERTRSHWAEARIRLFDLVRRGKLTPKSQTFREFYSLQTYILRSPDDYQMISRHLQESLLVGGAVQDPLWLAELPSWPAEMAIVLRHMGEGIAELAACYNPTSKLSKTIQRTAREFPLGTSTHTYSHPKRVRVILTEAGARVGELEKTAASKDSRFAIA